MITFSVDEDIDKASQRSDPMCHRKKYHFKHKERTLNVYQLQIRFDLMK